MTAWSEADPFGRTALVFTFKNQTISKTSAVRAGMAFADD